MKYKWISRPPIGVPGIASIRANVWPKPDAKSLKYAWVEKHLIAIGQLKNGRWEVYLLCWSIAGPTPHKIEQKWLAQSRLCKGNYRIGYSNYQNCYRSITQHLKAIR